MDHSTLSQVIRGKRACTWKLVQLLARRMRWTGRTILQTAADGRGFDSRRISRQLGIPVDEVNLALTDLCLFSLLELKGESSHG